MGICLLLVEGVIVSVAFLIVCAVPSFLSTDCATSFIVRC